MKIETSLYGIDITFFALTVIAVALRMWARWLSAIKYGWDDWLILLSTITSCGILALCIIMIKHGLGHQAVDVPPIYLMTIAKALYAGEMLYVVHLAIVKVAILVMYCRIFALRRFKIAAWILGSITVAWSLLFCFLSAFQCHPIERAWNLAIPEKCMKPGDRFLGAAVPNIVTDVVMLAMPVREIWKLHTTRSQQIALTGLFLLGGFVIVASAYRLTTIINPTMTNISYSMEEAVTWSHIECSVAVISACLPTFRPLVRAFTKVTGIDKTQNSHGSPKVAASENNGGNKSPKHRWTETTTLANSEVDSEAYNSAKMNSDESLPVNKIQVQHDVQQRVEYGGACGDWVNGRHRNWLPS